MPAENPLHDARPFRPGEATSSGTALLSGRTPVAPEMRVMSARGARTHRQTTAQVPLGLSNHELVGEPRRTCDVDFQTLRNDRPGEAIRIARWAGWRQPANSPVLAARAAPPLPHAHSLLVQGPLRYPLRANAAHHPQMRPPPLVRTRVPPECWFPLTTDESPDVLPRGDSKIASRP